MNNVKLSKFLSFVLRHKPDEIDITLDPNGWVDIDILLNAMAKKNKAITHNQLLKVVADCDKQRYKISDDGLRIRASQGHSIEVDLNYTPAKPPSILYHGTSAQFLDSILKNGIIKGKRHHVHLSDNQDTATKVGSRKGKPVILRVDSEKMYHDKYEFFVSDNGVWLTDHVPFHYIEKQ